MAAEVSGVPEVAHNENPGQAAAAGTQMRLRDSSTLKALSKYVVNIAIFRPPVTFQEATSGPDANNWWKAIDNELKQHEKNKTWELVPRRQGMRPIDSEKIPVPKNRMPTTKLASVQEDSCRGKDLISPKLSHQSCITSRCECCWLTSRKRTWIL